jgi:hypothetical protein
MYLYRPVLGSPHFWQTDKAPRFLKPRLFDWSTIHQRPKIGVSHWGVAGVDNTGASGLGSELVK